MAELKRIDVGDGVYIEVLREERNPLLSRLEVEGRVHHELKSTPSRASLREAIAKAYGKPTDTVYIKYIKTEYGIGVSRIHVHVYDSHDIAVKIEPTYILARHGEAEKKQPKAKQAKGGGK